MSARPVVAIVGAGASGCLTATHVARAARAAGRGVEILLVDPAPLGQGLAYSTPDPRHRLNVPATPELLSPGGAWTPRSDNKSGRRGRPAGVVIGRRGRDTAQR